LLLYLFLNSVGDGVIDLAGVFEVHLDPLILRDIFFALVLLGRLGLISLIIGGALILPIRARLLTSDTSCLLAKHLLLFVVMVEFLQVDLGTELLKVLVSLLENLKKS